MIKRLSKLIVAKYYERNKISEENIEMYLYCFEVLISTLINSAIIIAVGVVSKLYIETLVFSVCFVLFRGFCGGFHAKTHLGCIITLCLIVTVFVFSYTFLSNTLLFLISICMIIFNLISIILFAPVDCKNKPLSIAECKINRRKSLLLLSLATIINIVVLSVNMLNRLAFSFSYPIFTVSLLLIIGAIENFLSNKSISRNL